MFNPLVEIDALYKSAQRYMISEKTDFFLGAGQLNKIILYYGALQKNIAGAHN